MDKQPNQNHQEKSHSHPIMLIRHGQSQYNHQAEILRKKLGIGATWEQYKANPQFMNFKYSEAMMDCRLSQRGRQQCQMLRYKFNQQPNNNQLCFKLEQIDLILVSPLFRTLQSCSIIFKDIINKNNGLKQQPQLQSSTKKIPIIVQPLLSQSLRCACDVSYNLLKAKEIFPYYDYSAVDSIESSWYINNQVQEKRQLYKKILKENNIQLYEDTAVFITKYMQQTYNFESQLDLMDRAQRVKQKIKQYRDKYGCNNIAVVSHYYLIGHLITDKHNFDKNGKPLNKFDVKNATPITYSL